MKMEFKLKKQATYQIWKKTWKRLFWRNSTASTPH